MRSTTEPAKIGAVPMAPAPTEGHSPCLMAGRASDLLLGRAPGLVPNLANVAKSNTYPSKHVQLLTVGFVANPHHPRHPVLPWAQSR